MARDYRPRSTNYGIDPRLVDDKTPEWKQSGNAPGWAAGMNYGMQLGNTIRDAWDESDATDAATAASTQSTVENEVITSPISGLQGAPVDQTAYSKTATGKRELTAEGEAAVIAAGDEVHEPSRTLDTETKKQYRLGKAGPLRDKEFTADEKERAGLNARAGHYEQSKSRGASEKAAAYRDQVRGLDDRAEMKADRAMERSLVRLRLDMETQEAGYRKARNDVIVQRANMEDILRDPQHPDYEKTLRSLTEVYSASTKFDGNSTANVVKNPVTKELMIARFGDDKDNASSLVRVTPDLVKGALDKWTEFKMESASPADALSAARERVRVAEAERSHKLDARRTAVAEQSARTQELQAEAAIRHYGAQAAQWRLSYDQAKKDYDLKVSQFGPESPAAKSAKLTYEREQDFDNRVNRLTKLIEDGAHPQEIRREQVALESKHAEKSKAKVREYDTDGKVVGERLVSSFDPTYMKYQKEYMAREQEKVNAKYGPKANIQVQAQPDGSMRYRDPLTPEGKGYTSLDELVKARGLKPLYVEGTIRGRGLQ